MDHSVRVGLIGKWHIHAVDFEKRIENNEEASIVRVWAETEEETAAWANEINENAMENSTKSEGDAVCKPVKRWEDMLLDPEVDGVVICSRTVDHDAIVLAAAKEGKHIYVEKLPLVDVNNAYAVKRLIEENQILFMASDPVEKPELVYVKQVMDSGALGNIVNIYVRCVHDQAVRDVLPVRFYDPAEAGFGAMGDMGCHAVHTLAFLHGKSLACSAVVSSVSEKAKENHVEDQACAVYLYPDGCIGTAETSWVTPGANYLVSVCGTKGGIMIKNKTNIESFGDIELPVFDGDHDFWVHPLDHWIHTIKTDAKSERNGIDEAIVWCEMIQAAYKTVNYCRK